MKSFAAGFTAALSVVLGAAYIAICAAALLGKAASPDIYRTAALGVIVLVAVLLPWPEDDSWRRGAVVGIIAGVALAVGYELLGSNPSIGAGQIGALLGALSAIPVLGLIRSEALRARFLRIALLLLLLVVAVAFIRTILGGGGFGHDESAYVLKTRAWLEGTPDTGWQLHRAPFVSVLAIPVVALTESEVAVRLVGSLLAVAALVAVMLVAERMGGLWASLIAGATVGASLSYLRRGAEYLTDVPAAGILLLVVAVVLTIVRHPDTSRRLVYWLGALIAMAFYVRYQSALAALGIALATVIVWPGTVKRLLRPLAVAAGIAFVAILPHFVWATSVTGTPWGVVLATQDAGGREFLGQGLVDYARMFPKDLAGPAGAVFMAAGLLWMGWGLVKGWRERSDDARLAGFIAIVTVVAVVPLGLVAHGEPRFVFFPVWLLIATGAQALTRLVSRLSARRQVALVVIASLVWIPLFLETERRADRNAEARGQNFAVLVDAANAIEADAAGSCGVLTTYQPQVTWYSGCWTELFSPDAADLGVGDLQGARDYALLFENGKRQPTPGQQQEYMELGPVEVVPAQTDGIGDARVVFISDG